MPTILLSKIYPKGSALKNLRVGSTDVKYVKRGDGKLFYDTLKSTTYSKPSITLAYPTSSTSAAGGTTSPSSFSYSQSWYYTGHSGNTYSQTNKTSGATVEYSISGTGASINTSTGVVTWDSRGTSYASGTRSATVTVKVTINGQSNTKTFTVYQAKNVITSISVTVSAGALTNPATYAAGGATKSVANKTAASASATLTYSSGSTRNTSNSDYGTWTGPTYSWSSSQSYATLTSANSASLNVTMPSRGTTTGSARSATITRKASYTYTLSSSYNNASLSAVSNSANATATVTQQANSATTSYSYSSMALTMGGFTHAGNATVRLIATAYRTEVTTYTSGASTSGTAQNVNITDDCSFSITHQSVSNTTTQGTNGNISRFTISDAEYLAHASMGTVPGYDHVTVTATASGLSGISTASKSTYIYNTFTISYEMVSIVTSVYSTLVPWNGGSDSLLLKYRQIVTQTWSSKEEVQVSDSTITWSSGNGTLSNLSSNNTAASVDATDGTITWSPNSTTSQRTATITGTFTHPYGGGSLSFTATSRQAAGITSKFTTVTFRNTTSSGGNWTFNVAGNAAPTTQYYIGHSSSSTITFTISVGNASQTATGISSAKNVSTNTTHLFSTSPTGSGTGYTLTLYNTEAEARASDNVKILYIR